MVSVFINLQPINGKEFAKIAGLGCGNFSPNV